MTQKNKKDFIFYEDAVDFLTEKMKEGKHVIRLKPTGEQYTVEWWEHKTIEFNGEQVPDEIWVTREGEPILVQDLSEEHCKNIIRMILRDRKHEEEEIKDALGNLLQVLSDGLEQEGVDIKTVTLDQNEIDQEIDSLFPADVRRGPTIH